MNYYISITGENHIIMFLLIYICILLAAALVMIRLAIPRRKKLSDLNLEKTIDFALILSITLLNILNVIDFLFYKADGETTA
jgi:hypothetical protein